MRTRRRLITALSLVATLGLIASACGDDDDSASEDTGGAVTETTAAGATETTAAGATETTAAGATETTAAQPLQPGAVEKIGLVFDAIGRGDGSFNDSAAAGYDRANEELGIADASNEQVPAADGSDRADKLSLLCEGGYNPVIAVGFLF